MHPFTSRSVHRAQGSVSHTRNPRRANPQAAPVILSPRTRGGASRLALILTVLFITFGGLFCLFDAAIAGAYQYYQSSRRIVPGVRVGDIPLAGMTLDEAATLLEENWEVESKILVTNGLQSQEVTPTELGLHADAIKTAAEAQAIGHVGSTLARSAQIFASLKDGWQVAPVLELDIEAARARLEALAPTLGKPPRDATLRVEDGIPAPVPSEIGYTINIEETLAALAADPQAVLTSRKLQVIPMPVLPSVTDASAAIQQAQRLLDTPVTIHAYDPILNEYRDWSAPREVIETWLKVVPDQAGPAVTLDEVKVSEYLNSLSQELGPDRFLDTDHLSVPPVEAMMQGASLAIQIGHHPTRYAIQPGDTLLKISWNIGIPSWMIQQANPGLNPDTLKVGSELSIPSKDTLLPLPVIPNKRVVISINHQQLRVYQDGALIGEHPISTGIDRSPTQPGIFQVRTHEQNAYASLWDLHMPNFLGIYEAWPGFMNGIHGLPTLSNGRRLWGNILGRPASYGCIILDLNTAEWLYHWAEDGVVVEIRP